jgi:hypothetical protein
VRGWKPRVSGDIRLQEGPDGGIGRRARLRIWWSNPCGFESLSGHLQAFDDEVFATGMNFERLRARGFTRIGDLLY